MPAIAYTSSDFPSANAKVANGTRWENFEWSDLIWAAITVGRGGWFDVIQHGKPSAYEILFRACLLKTALQTPVSPQRFMWTSVYRNLDPSEKGAISYFIGLTMCKMFAERFLDVPWLLHLDVYRAQLNPILLRGRSRPDLVGQSVRGEWVVFESKGRTNGPSDADKLKAKVQARRLTHIKGQQIAYGVALFSSFYGGELMVHWQDPEPGSDSGEAQEPFSLNVERGEFLKRYYRPILDFVGVGRLREHLQTERPIKVEEADFSLGFEPRVLNALLAEDYDLVYRILTNRDSAFSKETLSRGLSFKQDGIAISAGESWGRTIGQQNLFE
jgi:hypothetical protein